MEFRIMDGNSPRHGTSLATLMDNAAKQLAAEVAKIGAKRVLIVCGPGNNGGDGLAMVPHLPSSVNVRVLLASAPRSAEAKDAAASLDLRGTPVEAFRTEERFRELARASDLVVDALLGSGVSGELRDPIRTLVRLINAAKRPVLSVDVPTGLGGRVAIKPTLTVTFHDRKQGMTSANSGRILVRPIGIPEAAIHEVGPGDFVATYSRNRSESHKGQNGRVLVVAGGPYRGAPILCAQAALRTGVDLVHLYSTRDAALLAQARQSDLIVHIGNDDERIGPADVAPIAKLLDRIDVLLVGPGLGDARPTKEAIGGVLKAAARQGTKVVLDADALAVAGKHVDTLRRMKSLCTPHAGEYRELTGKALPKDASAAKKQAVVQAARLRTVLLVKGAQDIIADARRVKTNRIHDPAMTTGGTGDVLAGIAAGFWSKGLDPFHAACAAAFVNGDAGLAVSKRQGGTLVASDLIDELPRVFQRWLGQ